MVAPNAAVAVPKFNINLLSNLTPPSLERTWLTAPHPTLPLVATCSSDKTVRIYSLTNFRLLSTISGGHKRSVRTCAWKPNVSGESVIATGSFDATVGIWRRWDNYEETVATAQENGDIPQRAREEDGEEHEDEEWRFAVLLDGHDSEVKSVSWSASGMLLATCSRDKSIWIWEDLDDGDNNFETVAVMQEHEGDVKCVAWHPAEECLASGSYDDTIRIWREDIDDWGQVACIRGHGGTVWSVDWESVDNVPLPFSESESEEEEWRQWHSLSGPRLASCSHDQSVRIWRRQPKAQMSAPGADAIPSIIRPSGTDETWEEDAVLPHSHELSIYAVSWSRRTGLLASAGADGRIVVYEERFAAPSQTYKQPMDIDPKFPNSTDAGDSLHPPPPTEWKIVGVIDGAHGIYEINHVTWAKRADRGREENKEEELLVTTADDGSIKVWVLTR
ncbi:iron-sulfur cluster assembly protein CIA1 [Aspergillus puulaauensis]|uniref:Probable cytosolic iron-sulfur protein assembly protein 1 n=1 Tax=Aspergillus puulaauensis TaxID=1220207 RepID=A0A7R7XQ05_9EURO|nr:cytosolic iron-sulfur protein assembly protein [Aspergillus puulaauensis]BCS25606.1 cytosolic iron-sulfur protein assembly protein [Aspergillus puulaauensis]